MRGYAVNSAGSFFRSFVKSNKYFNPHFIVTVAAEPGHGGVADYYKTYYGYNGVRNQVHPTEEKSNRRLVGSL